MKLTIAVSDYSEDNLPDQIVAALAEDIKKRIGEEIQRKVSASLTRIIETKADEMVAAALTSPRQTVDQWGEAQGQPTTLTAFLSAEFKKHMEKRVDSDGRNADYDRGTPRKDWLVQQFAMKPLTKEVEAIITEVRQESVEKAKLVIADLIASKLTK